MVENEEFNKLITEWFKVGIKRDEEDNSKFLYLTDLTKIIYKNNEFRIEIDETRFIGMIIDDKMILFKQVLYIEKMCEESFLNKTLLVFESPLEEIGENMNSFKMMGV